MPVWGALLGTLGWNIARHLRGKSTLCSSAAPYLSPKKFLFGWSVLTGWLVPHYCNRSREH